ncbi:LysM peptidoglycan-binding domain-containing protein [Carboxydocella sp. ULO1]|uniref:LysM peptidoglycan-binding domain-containing protein n=1 Tax=Carboxydocella sp. ULO1 TaxID=1926599 RepID=UPI0009AD800D|nr:LysM domain-containing protein [Carboxydocella sp. ULO1]GAW27972.1 hypothetical protein ULO1_05420 [Carboxydocella sp. ULO1]
MASIEWTIDIDLKNLYRENKGIAILFGDLHAKRVTNYLWAELKSTIHGQAMIPAEEWKKILAFSHENKVEVLGWVKLSGSEHEAVDITKYINVPTVIVLSLKEDGNYTLTQQINQVNSKPHRQGPVPLSHSPEDSNFAFYYKYLLMVALFFTIIFAFLYPVMRKIEQPVTERPVSLPGEEINKEEIGDPFPIEKKANSSEIKQEQESKTIQSKIQPEYFLYTVKSGDSLWEISKKFYGSGFEFVQIMQDNQIINPAKVSIGTQLKIRKK